MDEFYTAGGKASHVLHVLDTSETKKKANEVKGLFSKENSPSLVFQVAAVFHSVEVLVLRAAQGGGSAPTMQVCCVFQSEVNLQTEYDGAPASQPPIFSPDICAKSESSPKCLRKSLHQTNPKRRVFAMKPVLRQRRVFSTKPFS